MQILPLLLALVLTPTPGGSDYFVSSPAAGGIWKGDFTTGASTPLGLGLQIPHYGWFGPDGNFYVPDRGWVAIMKITPDGQVSALSAGGQFEMPVTCIPSLDGQALVVSDMMANKIFRVGYDGSQTLMYDNVSANGLLDWPDGMAFDDAGNLYVANLVGNSIVKFTPQGTASLFSASSLINQAAGLAIDGAGNLFVASYGNSTILRFRLDTGGEGEVFAGGDIGKMSYPNDLKLSRKGGFLVSTRQSSVCRIDALGGIKVEFQDDRLGELDGVSVPEDATLCTGRFTLYGQGKAGSGGVVPQLRAIFSPCPGQTIGIEMRDFVGGAPAVLFVGTGSLAQGAVMLKGASLLVNPAGSLFLPISFAFPGSGPGNGDLTMQFQLPNMPELIGFEFYHQVFALDPGAANGVSASNGLHEVIGN